MALIFPNGNLHFNITDYYDHIMKGKSKTKNKFVSNNLDDFMKYNYLKITKIMIENLDNGYVINSEDGKIAYEETILFYENKIENIINNNFDILKHLRDLEKLTHNLNIPDIKAKIVQEILIYENFQ